MNSTEGNEGGLERNSQLWHVDQTGEGTKIKDAAGNTVLWTQHTHLKGKRTDEEVRAIADLAAAAPAMLEALQFVAFATNPDDPESYRSDDREGCLDTVRAISLKAIAKAKGRS
jgi:hypothetical protein